MSSTTADHVTQPHISAKWTTFVDPPLAAQADVTMLALVLAAGLAFDLGFRSGVVTAGGALAVLVASVAMLASGRVRNPQARALIACAPLFGVWLMIRASAWLLPFDIIAVVALLVLGASLSSGASLFDLGVPQALARGLQAVVQAVLTPAYVIAGIGRTKNPRRAVRGIAIALPLLIVLAALFASADAVFARAFRFDLSSVVAHVIALGVGCAGMAWLLRMGSLEHVRVPEVDSPTLAPIEWTIVLGALDALLAAFAVAQIVALSSGGRHVLQTAGLTYAEYARTGFFQLVAAVAITGVALMMLRTAAGPASGSLRFRALAFGSIALTFAVVISAYHRLALYEHVFGLTMLRLYVHIAIVGAGLLLIAFAAVVAGLGRRRAWFAPAAGVLVLATLFGLNVVNPERFVARYNTTHRSAHFDPAYLSTLSTDTGLSSSSICPPTRFTGWAAFNDSRYRAQSLRKEHCG